MATTRSETRDEALAVGAGRTRVRPADVLLAIALVVCGAVLLSWIVLRWGGEENQVFINDFAFLPLGVLVVLALARACALAPTRRTRAAWSLIAIAMAFYWAGDFLWFDLEILQGIEVPSPSIADAAYLAFYPALAAGLLLLPRERAENRLRAILDMAIVVVGASTAVWWLVIGPVAASTGVDVMETAVVLAYPVGDCLMLSILGAAMVGRVRGTSWVALGLLGAGIAANSVADLAYARFTLEDTYASGAWVDTGFMIAWFLMGLAAIAQSHGLLAAAVAPSRTSRPLPVLPYVAIALVFVVLVLSTAGDSPDHQVVVAGSIGVTLLVVMRQFITARENGRLLTEMAARRSEARFAAIIRNASDVIAVVRPNGAVGYVTPSVQTMTGRAGDDLVGQSLLTLFRPADAPLVMELLGGASARGEGVRQVRCRAAVPADRHLEVEVANQLDDPLVGGLVVTIRDITERQAFEQQLRSQALHDPLTGLPNRVLLSDRIEQAGRRARRHGRSPAILFMDLDEFKGVNDTLGHAAGDELLVEIAERLRGCLRAGDTAARLGGDEFAILLEETHDVAEAVAAAERVHAALARPLELAGRPVSVAASIGIVRPDDPEMGAIEMLRDADIAMYAAKREAKGGSRMFAPEMYAATVERVRIESEIRQALDGHELEVVYQPLVAMDDERVIGVEALLRWNHPRRGLVMPDDFIRVAEACGEIGRIGAWVLRQGCATVGAWNASRSAAPLQLNVNVSARQLEMPFVGEVDSILASTGFPAGLLVLEITESVLAVDRAKVTAVLTRLRHRGVRIAIDDFGTGYSALSYLRDLPVDEIKIDRTFIRDLGAHADDGLVSTIISLGRGLAMTTTAEGIEHREQADLLRELGCDLGQGFLHGRPSSAASLGERLRADEEVRDLPRSA